MDGAPIFEIAGAAIDLVKDDAGVLTLLECGEHAGELASTDFRGRFSLLEPCGNGDAISRGEVRDGVFLFLQG
ncbi:MAG TPA: hypothetical protein VMU25_01630 [Candidatus Paceibacterota bacterium]|nr:hypothetical protein [Candidatus Paceibacterota bacterium]